MRLSVSRLCGIAFPMNCGFSRLRSTAEQSAIRMDYIYSVDGKFAALQLFQYSSLLYSPITEVYTLKGDDAGRFIDRVNQKNK